MPLDATDDLSGKPTWGYASSQRDGVDGQTAASVALLALETRARAAARALDAVQEAYVTLDRDFRITYVNAEAARINRKPAEQFVGQLHWDEWPAARGTQFERELSRAMEERILVRFLEQYYVPDEYDVWIDVTAYPAEEEDGGGLHLVYRDVTERIAREQREQLLAGLADRARTLDDPEELIADAVRAVGQLLQVSRCTFSDIDLEAGISTVRQDYCADGIDSVAGARPLSDYGPFIQTELEAGRPIVVNDVHADPLRVPPETIAAYDTLSVRAYATVPLVHTARLVSTIAVHSPRPRRWKPEEVDLLRTVIERTWLTVEVARQRRALLREIDERRQQERALADAYARERRHRMREGVLARIGAAVRGSLPPAEVQTVAVRALGKALGADRCFFATVDITRDEVVIAEDYHTEGVTSFAGEYRLSTFAVDVDEVFGGGQTLAVTDTQDTASPVARWKAETASVLAGMGVRALINVPFHEDERLVAALGLAMAGTPREWTPEEIALAEAVATEARAAVEAARARQREHRIAEQLQEALVPRLPGTMPGLALHGFYRAALREAGVGGDFTDVFPAREGALTCLVCADLSGKGLAAASQVATVRNMLRYALHSDGSLSTAVTRLNQVLAEQDLLTGFATLFVGMYDARTGALTYVNCGQEPGMLWRTSTHLVENLPPTGPVLGTFTGATFTEARVTLAPGDILGLFTDGMTDVGLDRQHLLKSDGLQDLFASCCAEAIKRGTTAGDTAAAIVDGLMAGVEEHVGGGDGTGVGDDIALLVSVVTAEVPALRTEANSPDAPALAVIPPSLQGAATPEQRWRAQRVIDGGLVGILQWTRTGGIVDANDTFLQMIGYTRDDLQAGRIDWRAITPAEWDAYDDRALEELARTSRHAAFEKEYFRKDGSRMPILVGGALFEGSPDEGVSFILDLSDRRNDQEALRNSEERLHLALRSGQMGAWDADLVAGTLTLSEEVPPLFGRLRAARTISFEEMMGWLPPEERERLSQEFATALRGEADCDVQFRALWPDGVSYRWVATRALITRDVAGTPVRAVGYTRDITQEKEREAERETLLARQREFMRDLVFSLTDGRFRLCLTEGDLPTPLTPTSEVVALDLPTLRTLRRQLRAATGRLEFPEERAQDIETAVGEAAMNAVVHGGSSGEGQVYADDQQGIVQVRVRDYGRGISEEALPRVLEKGVSSAGTLGHGFAIMLKTADRVWLLTGPGGTTLVLEQDLAPAVPAWLQTVGSMDD